MSIDTVHFMLGKCKIKPGALLRIHQGNIDFQTGETREYPLFTDTTGRVQYGTGAHKNFANGMSFDIIVNNKNKTVNNYVDCSLPKQIRESNLQPLSKEELPIALQAVENTLYEAGIETKIEDASISRLDMNRDILTEESVESYSKLFSILDAKRTKDKTTYGVNGWLHKNGRTQFCIYNKIEELKNNKFDVSDLPPNILRFEHRCLNGAKVKEFYKFTTVPEMMKYGFDALEKKASDTWRKDFFKYVIEEIEYKVESRLRTEMQYYQAVYGNRFFSKYLKVYGAYYLATSSGGVEVIKKALQNMECTRLRIYRAEKELKESILSIEAMQPEPISRKSLGSLYNELKEKVCK